MAPLEQFRVREKLFRILETAGATETIFTPKQILTYLGKYIEQKELHDTKNMRIVRCKGDALEDLFGVEEFVIGSCKEIWNFIFPYIIPATNKEPENTPAVSETSEDANVVTKLEHSWMKQLPWWYFVQKPEEAKTATGSIMDNSTAFVQDTEYSTELSSSIKVLSHDERFSVEFEPDSGSSSATDSDGTESIVSEEEMAYSTPSLPLTDSSDCTLIDDYWECSECPNMNPPIVGYCQRCWKLRNGWLKSSVQDIAPLKSLSLTSTQELSDIPLLQRCLSDPQGVDVTDGKSLKRTRGNNSNLEDMGPPKKLALEQEATLTAVTSQSEDTPSSSSQSDVIGADTRSFDSQPGNGMAHLSLPTEPHSIKKLDSMPPNGIVQMSLSREPRNISEACSLTSMSQSSKSSNTQPANIAVQQPSSSEHSKIIKSNSQTSEPQAAVSIAQLPSANHNIQAQPKCLSPRPQNANGTVKVSKSFGNEQSVKKNSFLSLPFNKPRPPEMPGICNICRSHPNDASFVHGQVGHQYCCYRCASKVLKKDGRCPVCREAIDIVIKNYIYQM